MLPYLVSASISKWAQIQGAGLKMMRHVGSSSRQRIVNSKSFTFCDVTWPRCRQIIFTASYRQKYLWNILIKVVGAFDVFNIQAQYCYKLCEKRQGSYSDWVLLRNCATYRLNCRLSQNKHRWHCYQLDSFTLLFCKYLK